ncbi:proline/glycine betaine ABC transporter permease [Pokkaliibacter sp. MBI-7]|uniref:ABC transporter permease n=1 Tax=Pokkaliibacter sp. MBI-7 TaxID=3040600 RepID=UPI00244BE9B1|nr:proline/glycine betaine ABC transporter permease [Pokkaliibacter sp. MBI-7]MDH2431200.1 proline/glycine betaine ABC transporter permease [Pokkaliibacter sp. MBI-7]
MFPKNLTFSMADGINNFVDWLVMRYGDSLRHVSDSILSLIVGLEGLLRAIPWWAFLILAGALAWHASKRWAQVVVVVALLYFVGAVGLWDKLMQTLALMMVATLLSVAVGIPLGILSAGNDRFRTVLLPMLDIMQTMPSFVYLIPVLMLFGLGKVPAILATVIYAAPPLIRLTDLGIRQVDKEVMEAVTSFGANRWQKLFGVQIPLALPSIMAGLNQTTMMALSMVVIASMIGARGLGEDVLIGIQTLDVGKGLEAGLAIVILAVVIDRITQAYGKPRHHL